MSRDIRFDTIRAVAIICVIWIHSMGLLNTAVENGNQVAKVIDALSNFIYCGVPLFVMLSGALLLGKKEPLNIFFKKRLKRILIPFIFWSIVVAAILFYQDGGRSFLEYILFLIKGIVTSGVHSIYWYVYLIIGLYLLTPILRAVVQQGRGLLLYASLLCLVIVILGTAFPAATLFSHWLCENSKMLFFYMAGYLIVTGVNENRSFNFNKLFLILFLVFYATNAFATFKGMNIQLLDIALSLSLFGVILTTPILSSSKIVLNSIQKISKYSYGIYLSHFMIISAIVKTGLPYHLPLWIEPIMMVFVVFTVEMALFYIADRLHLGKIVF